MFLFEGFYGRALCVFNVGCCSWVVVLGWVIGREVSGDWSMDALTICSFGQVDVGFGVGCCWTAIEFDMGFGSVMMRLGTFSTEFNVGKVIFGVMTLIVVNDFLVLAMKMSTGTVFFVVDSNVDFFLVVSR